MTPAWSRARIGTQRQSGLPRDRHKGVVRCTVAGDFRHNGLVAVGVTTGDILAALRIEHEERR